MRKNEISSIVDEIRRLSDGIDKAYKDLGESVSEMSNEKNEIINKDVDKIVELKIKLKKIKEQQPE